MCVVESTHASVTVSTRAAVPFRVGGVETHLAGTVTKLRRSSVDVLFDDDGETWEVSFTRLFQIESP